MQNMKKKKLNTRKKVSNKSKNGGMTWRNAVEPELLQERTLFKPFGA